MKKRTCLILLLVACADNSAPVDDLAKLAQTTLRSSRAEVDTTQVAAKNWPIKSCLSDPSDIAEHTVSAADVARFHFSVPAKIHATRGKAAAVKIVAPRELLAHIEAKVVADVMRVEATACQPDMSKHVRISVVFAEMSDVVASGATDLEIASPVTSPKFSLSGASRLRAAIAGGELTLKSVGATQVVLRGSAKQMSLELSGASQVDAKGLRSEATKAKVAGAARLTTHTTKTLTVDIRGSGSVGYRGQPTLRQEITGAATIRPL